MIRKTARNVEHAAGLCRHTVGQHFPIIIRPQTRRLTVAITAQCNLRCVGCRYGRDFMVGHQLSLPTVKELLEDCSAVGVDTVRLYGGEPLLHRELPQMVSYALKVGVKPYVTTNGILLEQKFDELHSAGLRAITIGFYGTGDEYSRYVQRDNQFERLERGLGYVRERYGMNIEIQFNFLLMRPSCSPEAVHAAWRLAEKYDTNFRTDLIHYSLPYFSEGPNRELQFTPEDAPRIFEVVRELEGLKRSNPERFNESVLSIRSIPDWLLKGPNMRVPCDAYEMVWVGADGTVKLCYVTFLLGNLRQNRLREILYTEQHRQAARDAFQLNCPNCHCGRDIRIQRHVASRRLYS